MKTIVAIGTSFALAVYLVGAIAKTEHSEAVRPTEGNLHIVLIGASIGKAWNLPQLPKRVGNDRYTFEALQVWDYDKSEAVDETLMRPARKFHFTRTYLKGFFEPSPRVPDVVILKECSSYFSGAEDLQHKKEMFRQWVAQVRQKNIAVMVTTVAPITRERAAHDGAAKHQAIREFNDWMRAYAAEQRLVLLDLEKALRTDDKERYLRDDLTSGDGSHVNSAAYKILDGAMLAALRELESTPRMARASAH